VFAPKGACLRNAAIVARVIALKYKIPLIGVNHSLAHIEIGRLTSRVEDPLTLYVSGGNTMVSAFDEGRYRVFGETLDIPIGNLLDSFARAAGLKHPGGPKIEELAKKSKKYIELPYTVKGMDLSYSGLLTAAVNKLGSASLEDLCYSLQETAFAMLVEVTERALAHTEKPAVLLTGGVAANKRLQQMLEFISKEHEASFHVVQREFSGDNGAMIAWTGMLHYKCGQILTLEESIIKPRWRLDDVEVPWRSSKC